MSIIQGLIGGVSNTVKYEIVPNYTYIDEGGTASPQTVTYTITTGGVADGTILYWDNAGTTAAADIGGSNTGSVTISGNGASITLTATTDTTTEGSETIIIRLFKDSGRAQLVATAATVTVGDTSLDPPIPGSAIFNQPEGDYMVLGPTGSYGGSASFSGTGQYLSTVDSGLDLTGDFTVEGWFYPTDVTGTHALWTFGQANANRYTVQLSGTAMLTNLYGAGVTNYTSTVPINTWTHVAMTRLGTTVNIYINGTASATTDTQSGTIGNGGYLNIGADDSGGANFAGRITNFRVVNGTAVYTGNFTPATTPLSATQPYGGWGKTSNISQIDSGTKLLLLTVTSPTLLTDSSGNNLTVTNNNGVTFASTTNIVYYDFNLGTTWTIEFWIKANNASNSGIHIPGGQWGLINQGGWYGGMPNNSILIGMAGGYLTIAQDPNHDIQFAEPTPGEWTHVAVVNNGGGSAQKVYYNGVEQTKTSGSYYSNGWTNIYQPLYIGRLAPVYGSHFDGKLTNIRITNTAVYTAGFMPPYTQPTIIGGHTKLIWAPTQYSITTDGGDHATTITNNGAAADTDYPLPITHGSVGFDNTPRQMAVTDASQFGFGTTWTIEWWQKADLATTSGNLLTILCQGPGNINSGRIDIFCQNGNLYVGNGNSIGAEPTPSVWTHVALVSNSGVLTVYYNGVQQFSSLINYSITNTADALYIGKRGPSVGGQNFRGKLTNIHMVNTADKYTAAFIPAVLPLKITGTVLLWAPTNRSIVADTSNYAQTLTNTDATYSTEYPNEFAYEAIHPHSGAGILTMTKSINGLSVQAGATNFDDTPAAGSYITIDGVTVASDYTIGVGVDMTRGHTMVVVNKETNAIESINVYDTWQSPTVIETPLSIVPNGRIVILVTYDATSCTSNMRNTLVNSYGASTPGSYATWTTERVSQLFIGVKR